MVRMILGTFLLLLAAGFAIGLVCLWVTSSEPDRYMLLIGAAVNLCFYGVPGTLLFVYGRRAHKRWATDNNEKCQQQAAEGKLQRTEYARRLAESELGRVRAEIELQRLAQEERRRLDDKAGQLGISTQEMERIEEQERAEAKRVTDERHQAVGICHKKEHMINVPQITQSQLAIQLVDTTALENPGSGGYSFQQAIKSGNEAAKSGDDSVKRNHYLAAIQSFEDSLRQGLDPLRQGYVHAQLGELMVKTQDLTGAVEHFVKVFSFTQALYDSVHTAAQYLGIVLSELGRQQEASSLQQLTSRIEPRVGHSLSAAAKDAVRKLVRANKPA